MAENVKIAERNCGILLLARSGFPRAVLLFLVSYIQRILHRSGWIARFIWEVNKIYDRRNVNVLLHWCTILGCARQPKNPIYVEHFFIATCRSIDWYRSEAVTSHPLLGWCWFKVGPASGSSCRFCLARWASLWLPATKNMVLQYGDSLQLGRTFTS